MSRILRAFAVSFAITSAATTVLAHQPGSLTSQTERLQTEILVSTLATPDLTREITAEHGTIEHQSEVSRGAPVAAVVRTSGCQAENTECKVNADVTVYRPDGSVFHEVKNLDLPRGRAAIPLKVDAQAPTGVYRVVALVRDLAARRFAKVERQFGVK